SKRLLINDPNKYYLFKRENRSIIVHDNTKKYEILPLYAEVSLGENFATSGYLNIKVNRCESEYEDRT
ncbi:11167_t:CDS:1, partial [Funneliformis caledonium]